MDSIVVTGLAIFMFVCAVCAGYFSAKQDLDYKRFMLSNAVLLVCGIVGIYLLMYLLGDMLSQYEVFD